MDAKMRDRAAEIREFNRFYTNIIGLVNRHILESPYSLAEARILLEIEAAGQCTARDLTRLIDIDPGYLSRMLSRFIKNGLVAQSASSADGRAKILSLTGKGHDAFQQLSETSNLQIVQLLEQLSERNQKKLVSSMQVIKAILSHHADRSPGSSGLSLRTVNPLSCDGS
ncbi:MAG: MarR family winged helix-turn-helix transcriptional regulator [Thermovirgaceae bacterium]|nr:MarR family winged helix-turn-helix transcriptional regulator [Thermovirgaceae bacterium]